MQDDTRSLSATSGMNRRSFVIGTASLGAAAAATISFSAGATAALPSSTFIYSAAAVPVGAVWNGMAFNDFTGYVARYTPPQPRIEQALAEQPQHSDFWSLYYAYA